MAVATTTRSTLSIKNAIAYLRELLHGGGGCGDEFSERQLCRFLHLEWMMCRHLATEFVVMRAYARALEQYAATLYQDGDFKSGDLTVSNSKSAAGLVALAKQIRESVLECLNHEEPEWGFASIGVSCKPDVIDYCGCPPPKPAIKRTLKSTLKPSDFTCCLDPECGDLTDDKPTTHNPCKPVC